MACRRKIAAGLRVLLVCACHGACRLPHPTSAAQPALYSGGGGNGGNGGGGAGGSGDSGAGAGSSGGGTSSVRLLGFYANGNAEEDAAGDGARFAAVHANLFATANLSAIEGVWARHQMPGMLTVDSVWLYHTNPVTHELVGGLRPGWRAHLSAMLNGAMPLVLKGGLKGFFLGDEICCRGVPGANVSSVATAIRQALGNHTGSKAAAEAIIFLNECSRAMIAIGETVAVILLLLSCLLSLYCHAYCHVGYCHLPSLLSSW